MKGIILYYIVVYRIYLNEFDSVTKPKRTIEFRYLKIFLECYINFFARHSDSSFRLGSTLHTLFFVLL